VTQFTHYDFTESLAQAEGFTKDDIAEAISAWGEQGDYAEWRGGFLLHLKDGRYAYVEGWCDTSGWGCQDDVETALFAERPELSSLSLGCNGEPIAREWDEVCADLNRVLRGEIEEF
jgi:hypothetical protein